MRKIREVIVVEGRYDKNTLAQVVDAPVVTLGGFAVFNDREKVAFLRRLAEERGLIVLTDSDGAGFVIRNYLKGALPKDRVKQAYIPDIHGKEKRKRTPGKEGKLGVEGIPNRLLLEEYKRLQVQLQMSMVGAAGEMPSEDMQRFQQLASLLYMNSDVQAYLMAEMQMQKTLADIFKILTEAAGIRFDVPDKQ